MDWERSSIEAAAAYLREMIEAGADDFRTKTVYEGLLDVLDRSRYATRIQRAAAADAAAAIMQGLRDRRNRLGRRGHTDRRLINLGAAADGERRAGFDRRAGQDRRGAMN
jgi:hypothetical protein